DKTELFENLGAEFFQLLGGVSIARSRRHIRKYYSDVIDEYGDFPTQLPPENCHPSTDLSGELSYNELANQIGDFALSIYRPSTYVDSEEAKQRLADEKARLRFNQEDRERFLIGMMQTNFLKRLESSAHSLSVTLERTIKKHDDMLEKIEKFEKNSNIKDATADVLPDDDEDDEEFLINRAKNPYHLKELDCVRWKQDIIKDKQTLTEAWDKVKSITPDRDGKLKEIKKHIKDKVDAPSEDKDGNPNRKLLIFTTFKDTAEYLYNNLSEFTEKLNLKMAMVSGDMTRTTIGQNNFNDILTNFAPKARNRADGEDNNINIVIATDCISEGQNLQDCDTVLNYDIHWNPVRIIQRFGRIDRIGSNNLAVRMINYWPTEDMEVYLRLRNRVESRMALADATASGDDDPLNEWTYEEAQMTFNNQDNFRDKQLEDIRKGDFDLDDLPDNVVMSDFTLDYFYAQLQKYIEKNKTKLEATPDGAYAVTDYPDKPDEKGVIFFLRLQNASDNKQQRTASPIHPYYAVYIRNNEDIRYGSMNAKQVLDLFEAATENKTEAINDLCLKFDQETEFGEKMDDYNNLLDTVISDIKRSHTTVQTKSMGRGGSRDFKLPIASEAPKESSDFKLVTWLVIT
ncbi:SWF/SNF helicase family protein, partial [Candidatus Poribacteria bacterium]|nr:SWF/SNF helicase family protein [Candidatus Poribacteria bacterium]MYB64082.1 SWF/SNF helicase family protein [Candidatus Poribacteria bacterium]